MEINKEDLISYAASYIANRANYPLETVFQFALKEFVIDKYRFSIVRNPELHNTIEDFEKAAYEAGIPTGSMDTQRKQYNGKEDKSLTMKFRYMNLSIEYIEYKKFTEFSFVYSDWDNRIKNLETIEPMPLMESIMRMNSEAFRFRDIWDENITEILKKAKVEMFIYSTWKTVLENRLNNTSLPYYFWGVDLGSVCVTIALSKEYQCTYRLEYNTSIEAIDKLIADAVKTSEMLKEIPPTVKIQSMIQGCHWQNGKP